MKKKKKIPRFKSIAEEQLFWAIRDSADYVNYDAARAAVFPDLKPSNRTISIRLPESLIESIKVLANQRGISYQAMLKLLLAEKVREMLGVNGKKDHAA